MAQESKQNMEEHGHFETDVLIIGAGISGLCAARLLQKHGVDVLVAEARDRVGGRTLTVQGPYGYTDLGGSYVGPAQDRVLRLIKELGLETYKVYDCGQTILNIKNTWTKFKGTIPKIWNPIYMLELGYIMNKVDAMSQTVPLDAPWKAENAEEWDTMTVKEFVGKQIWTDFVKEMMKLMVNAVLCVELHEVSLLYLLWYIHSGHGVDRLLSVTNGAQERKINGGAQQLSQKMARELHDKVFLSSPVIQLVQHEKCSVTAKTANGLTIKCKYAISAVPQAILGKMTFVPNLPSMKMQLLQRIPMGSILKVILFYEKAFWKAKAVSDGVVDYCLDDTKPDGSHPAIMCFVHANHHRRLCQLPQDQRKKEICQSLAESFKDKQFLQVVHYVECDWSDQLPYSGGCVVALIPGTLTRYGRFLREPVGRLYFAGTESATCWAGYMDGAIESGERAAREILHDLGHISKESIWQEETPSADVQAEPFKHHWIEEHIPSLTTLLLTAVPVLLVILGVVLYPLSLA